MTRYLMFISYMGTRFRGIQKQISKANLVIDDPLSVQGMLEIALKRFRLANVPNVIISSRTDAGVHALRTAVHVDLERDVPYSYDPDAVVFGINRYFEKSDIAIRVQECQIVPETLHARHSAIKRSYLYRLAIRKADAPALPPRGKDLSAQIPFADWRRCYFIQGPDFDEEKFRLAANLFPGEKDFRTFMGSAGSKRDREREEISTVRNLHFIDISVGQPSLPCYLSTTSSHYNYLNVVICSKSFVYRQVRRMIGVLVAVAQGKLDYSDVEHMLSEPSPNSWNNCVVPAPAYGLYMLNVEYNTSDLSFENEKPITDSEINPQLMRECKSPIGR